MKRATLFYIKREAEEGRKERKGGREGEGEGIRNCSKKKKRRCTHTRATTQQKQADKTAAGREGGRKGGREGGSKWLVFACPLISICFPGRVGRVCA